MDSKTAVMKTVFQALSEQNREVMILLAKSMVVAQDSKCSTLSDDRLA